MLKNEVLKILLSNSTHISGQDISERLQVSRTAVWKSVSSLKKEGYVIESVNNKGYLLLDKPDVLNYVEIERNILHEMDTHNISDNTALSPADIFRRPEIIYLDSVDSTNSYAKALAEKGKTDFLVVSDMQTLGRGRRGRSWVSPSGVGIWMSLCLCPDIRIENASMITLVMALSLSESIEEISNLSCAVKWPNDIVINSKKLAGILTEMSSDTDGIRYIVSGVGINANNMDFPKELSDIASSLYIESGVYVDRARLIACTIRYFYQNLHIFLKTEDMSNLKEKYEGRLANIDNEVTIIDPKGSYTARALGIDSSGALLVEKGGKITRIVSGEVSIRGRCGYI